MPQGVYQQAGTISTNADTAISVTPAAGERIYIKQLKLTVSIGGTTSRLIVQDGVGGGVIARMATTAADAMLDLYFTEDSGTMRGLPLGAVQATAPGNVVNVNTTGGAAATVNYFIVYEVR